ncbi:MAG: SDR family oxidoreductase [Chloroflexota bacterium]|nr:SDR family oxidoreductase [Chloroflexota bacterium]
MPTQPATIEPTALITGGSRGVGAATALALAGFGFDIASTYRNEAARAESVVGRIEAAGRRTVALGDDMTQFEVLEAWLTAVERSYGRPSAVVLDASGRLEREFVGAHPRYPFRINRDAQLALLERSLPLIRRGATVVLVTNHRAHRHGEIEQSPAYEPGAASKHAGELAGRALLPAPTVRCVRLLVATGDLIEGTITAKLLERAAPGEAVTRGTIGGRVTSVEEMGAAIAAAVVDGSFASGHTVVVGEALDSLVINYVKCRATPAHCKKESHNRGYPQWFATVAARPRPRCFPTSGHRSASSRRRFRRGWRRAAPIIESRRSRPRRCGEGWPLGGRAVPSWESSGSGDGMLKACPYGAKANSASPCGSAPASIAHSAVGSTSVGVAASVAYA